MEPGKPAPGEAGTRVGDDRGAIPTDTSGGTMLMVLLLSFTCATKGKPGADSRPQPSSRSGGWRRRRARCHRGSTRKTGCNRATAHRSERSHCRRRPPGGPARHAKRWGEPLREFLRHLPERQFRAGAGRVFYQEIVAVELVVFLERLDQREIDGEPDRPAPVGIPPEGPGG